MPAEKLPAHPLQQQHWKRPFKQPGLSKSQVKDLGKMGKHSGTELGNLQLRFC